MHQSKLETNLVDRTGWSRGVWDKEPDIYISYVNGLHVVVRRNTDGSWTSFIDSGFNVSKFNHFEITVIKKEIADAFNLFAIPAFDEDYFIKDALYIMGDHHDKKTDYLPEENILREKPYTGKRKYRALGNVLVETYDIGIKYSKWLEERKGV